MKKRASGKGKIRTEIWVALIGLAGVIVTAIFGSPALIKLLERTPAPTAWTEGGVASTPVMAAGCQPAEIAELPAQTVAVIQSIDGTITAVPLDSLRFEYQTGLRLASGTNAEFSKMKRVDFINPDFTDTFSVEVNLTLLDCTVHHDIINSGSDSNLTGISSLGAFQLHILQVKSIAFEW